jgi:hypothetical protein
VTAGGTTDRQTIIADASDFEKSVEAADQGERIKRAYQRVALLRC